MRNDRTVKQLKKAYEDGAYKNNEEKWQDEVAEILNNLYWEDGERDDETILTSGEVSKIGARDIAEYGRQIVWSDKYKDYDIDIKYHQLDTGEVTNLDSKDLYNKLKIEFN